jgi:hypothetical protein
MVRAKPKPAEEPPPKEPLTIYPMVVPSKRYSVHVYTSKLIVTPLDSGEVQIQRDPPTSPLLWWGEFNKEGAKKIVMQGLTVPYKRGPPGERSLGPRYKSPGHDKDLQTRFTGAECPVRWVERGETYSFVYWEKAEGDTETVGWCVKNHNTAEHILCFSRVPEEYGERKYDEGDDEDREDVFKKRKTAKKWEELTEDERRPYGLRKDGKRENGVDDKFAPLTLSGELWHKYIE